MAHACIVTDTQQRLLQQYCKHLWSWNKRLNLTRHTDYEAFVSRDLRDSQQLANHLQSGESLLDAGSGGGVPGIVLAVLNPALTVSLSESTQKKAAVLKTITGEMNLPMAVFAQRAEDVLGSHSFDTICARAVAPLKKMVLWFRPQRPRMGRLLLVKGPAWKIERDEAAEAGLLGAVDLQVLSEYATAGRRGKSVILEVRFQ